MDHRLRRPRSGTYLPHEWGKSNGGLTCCYEQLYAYRDTYGSEKETYVEFVDVGGHPKYEISRGVFYNDVQGREDSGRTSLLE